MAAPVEIKIYKSGESDPVATVHSSDGLNYSASLDLPNGVHYLEVTARRVGQAESARSATQIVVVGADTPPVITSPLDWTEVKDSVVTVSVQANPGETIRVFFDGVAKSPDLVADGSGLASSSYVLGTASVPPGIDTRERITACRVISGNLSHASDPVHVVCTYGHLPASGVTTLRLLSVASLLGFGRVTYGGSWDNEAFTLTIGAPYQYTREIYRKSKTTAEAHTSLLALNVTLGPLDFRFPNRVTLPEIAPGYYDSNKVHNHLDRVKIGAGNGYVNSFLKATGDPIGLPPTWFDFATSVALAYFRGDKSVYDEHKVKIIEILNNLSPNFIDDQGLVRQGNGYYPGWGGLAGWPGIPVDRGAGWYSSNPDYNETGVTEIQYWPFTEATCKWSYATGLVKLMARMEGDSVTEGVCDSFIATFNAGVTGRLRSDNLVKEGRFPYNDFASQFGPNGNHPYPNWTPDQNAGFAATALAIAVNSFSGSQRAAVATAFKNILSRSPQWSETSPNNSPLYMGCLIPYGNAEIFGHSMYWILDQYMTTHWMGVVAFAASIADPTLGRNIAEDIVRWRTLWFQNSALGWLGFDYAHSATSTAWSHWSGSFSPDIWGQHAWLQNADDRYADLGPVTLGGALNSTATLRVELGHRVTGIQVDASSSCTATIEIYANEMTNGMDAFCGKSPLSSVFDGSPQAGTMPWPPTPTYGPDILVGTVTITSGTTASVTSGLKPAACFSGGQLKAKVTAVTGGPDHFTVTLKQSQITPSFEPDPALGFTDNFSIDRLAEYTAIDGNISTCSVVTRDDTSDPALGSLAPFKRTMFKTTATGQTSLVQTNTHFADGIAMVYQAMRTDRVYSVNSSHQTIVDPNPTASLFFRVSADGLTYIKVTSNGGSYAGGSTVPITITEVVNGAVVNTQTINLTCRNHWSYSLWDEMYLLAWVEGNKLHAASWIGGSIFPWPYGKSALYTFNNIAEYTIGSVFSAGACGFGVLGPSELESFRCCGFQDQPIPPGFILDTGLNVPKTEYIIPSCYVTGTKPIPASDKSCLRNEWGAVVSEIVSLYNPRWSY